MEFFGIEQGTSFTFVLVMAFYALICYLIILLIDNASGNKLDLSPIFWGTFLLTPIFGALLAIVNIISKQDKEPKTLENDK